MRELALLPIVILGGVAFAIIAAALLIIGTLYAVLEFIIRGHEPTPGGICEVCGGLWQSAPTHRWQVLAYLRWLFQHGHSRRERSTREAANG